MEQTPAQLSPEEIKQACVVHYFVSQLSNSERWRHGHLPTFSADPAQQDPAGSASYLKKSLSHGFISKQTRVLLCSLAIKIKES